MEAGIVGGFLHLPDEAMPDWLIDKPADWRHLAVEGDMALSRKDVLRFIRLPDCDRATAAHAYAQQLRYLRWQPAHMQGFAGYWGHFKTVGRDEASEADRLPEVIGRAWKAGAYDSPKNRRLAFDLGAFLPKYRMEVAALRQEGRLPDWAIPPDDLVATEGQAPDCPFFFDGRVIFMSIEHEKNYTGPLPGPLHRFKDQGKHGRQMPWLIRKIYGE
ncbi:MAG: hypothetical protein AAF577_12665 [Pseudomonadota bacterium]